MPLFREEDDDDDDFMQPPTRHPVMNNNQRDGKLQKKNASRIDPPTKIVYLDNLSCKHQINHKEIPRAKYFNQDLIKKIVTADKTKDDQGMVTFGRLPVRHSNYCPPFLKAILCVNAYLRPKKDHIWAITGET